MLSTQVRPWAPALSPAAPRDETEPVRIASEPLLAERPVILVVDDDDDARETVATLLGSQGLSVVQVSTGEAALTVAACFPVAAVILDVLLPDRTGFDVCRALRADPATQDIPVIMLTALTEVAEEVSGVLAGADAFLVKPASRDRLLQHLSDLL